MDKTIGHNTGAIPSPIDKRDFSFNDIAMSSAPFDWEKGFDIEKHINHTLKVKDQNGSFSCGGQAFAYYMEVLDVIYDKEKNEKSARYIYAPIAYPGGGSTARDLCDRVIKVGSANETLVPSYDNGKPPTESFMIRMNDFTDAINESAKTDRASVYVQDNTRNIDTIAQMARDNNGCVIGISGVDNGTWRSAFPKAQFPTAWNHWVYVGRAKMINGKKYIGIINSWGNIGEFGWQWISESFFPHLCFEARALVIRQDLDKLPFLKNLEYGDSGSEVSRLQTTLIELGYDIPLITSGKSPKGHYGGQTQNAVFAFQDDHVQMTFYDRYFLKGKFFGFKSRTAMNRLLNL